MHISSPIKSHKLRLWLSFVAGVLANALLGPSEIFYIYANELQVIFNINKKQVEMFASIQTIGNGIGFVLCTFTDSLNPMCFLVVGFLFTLIGPAVLWVATLDKHMTNSYFIMFGFLCNGLSDSIQIIISQKIVAKNFSSSNRGIIMAVLSESICIGMLLFSVVYYIIPTQAFLIRAPSASSVVWPGCYEEYDIPSEIELDCILAIEPHTDASRTKDWPSPQTAQSVAGKIRIVNNTLVPQFRQRNEHFCRVRLTTTIDNAPEVPDNMRDIKTTNYIDTTHTSHFSKQVSVDPDNLLSPDLQIQFNELLRKFSEDFSPNFEGYNGTKGPFEASVNVGLVQPPQRKYRMPQDSYLKQLNISIEICQVKNQNKNPFTDKAIAGLEDELLNEERDQSPQSENTLVIATKRLNPRLCERDQLRASSYKVKLSECYKVLNTLNVHRNPRYSQNEYDQESDCDDHDEDSLPVPIPDLPPARAEPPSILICENIDDVENLDEPTGLPDNSLERDITDRKSSSEQDNKRLLRKRSELKTPARFKDFIFS
ncbi:unnamed protein product [Mytilus coruscus]|uniref:Nodulin-like domain-containing protein n=1 Tax=Mytilus coruscus TaxID=42192 RepID=A0A6J8A4F0_MYTCO|nr:unnamed protein product [Mytilus coruscus]